MAGYREKKGRPAKRSPKGGPVRGPRATAPRLASLDGSTPDQAYFTPLPFRVAAFLFLLR